MASSSLVYLVPRFTAPHWPGAHLERKQCPLFPDCCGGRGSRFSPLFALPPRVLSGDPRRGLALKHRIAPLQLISEGALEDGGVEALSDRLGIGSRHLHRLFLRHLGATTFIIVRLITGNACCGFSPRVSRPVWKRSMLTAIPAYIPERQFRPFSGFTRHAEECPGRSSPFWRSTLALLHHRAHSRHV